MSKNFQLLLRLCFVFIVIVIGDYVIAAQTVLTGTWKTSDSNWNRNRRDKDDDDDEKRGSKNKVHLNFSFDSDGKNRNSNGSSFDYSELQGLTESQISGANSPVKFSIVREAGTIECEGTFQNGKGAGTFRFSPSSQFVSAMKTRGFDFTESSNFNRNREDTLENRLFAAAIINVTTALADDLNSANFGKLDTGDLFSAAIFKVDSKFMREMKATGFPNLDFGDLVKARIFKIDADYVKKVAGFGFKNQSFEDLVKMKIFKITPEYAAEMRNLGFPNLDMGDLVKMRIFKIDGAFVQKARAEGVPLNVEDLVQKRIGVWRR